jgi:DNA helicase HerA-like ATPase
MKHQQKSVVKSAIPANCRNRTLCVTIQVTTIKEELLMSTPLCIAKNTGLENVLMLPEMANRHGLITGATGTGKTVTLQKMAEAFSSIGVPVFVADVKGDLSGIAMAAAPGEKLTARLEKIGITDWRPQANPAVLWDVFGEKGHPVRATVSDMGPLLLSRLLNLNDVQSGLLQMIFKIADDNNMLLLDMKDLRAMTQYVADHAADFKSAYGNITAASAGAIQRGLLTLDEQGASNFFGEHMLDLMDFIRTDASGKGMINILAADKLYNMPALYAITLLWMLSELFEQLPEAGDLPQPKLVFFFDEAHLLFSDAPPVLLEKIERVVRLIRSKGVGIYFVTQNPLDVPDKVLGQLGNRVQHALRAFTPRDQKAVKAAAQTMRANPAFNTEQAIQDLGTGEALISFLDEKGSPSIVQRCSVIAPGSRLGPVTPAEQDNLIKQSIFYGRYEKALDRESAYEMLMQRTEKTTPAGKIATTEKTNAAGKAATAKTTSKQPAAEKSLTQEMKDFVFGSTGPRGGKKDGLVQTAAKSAARTVTTSLVRGVLGSLAGKR